MNLEYKVYVLESARVVRQWEGSYDDRPELPIGHRRMVVSLTADGMVKIEDEELPYNLPPE
jgi:hypothetical protein